MIGYEFEESVLLIFEIKLNIYIIAMPVVGILNMKMQPISA